VGSWLDARRHGGHWRVRIEDLDPLRTVPGAADAILATLESFGLTWDGGILYQSRRTEAYEAALARLSAAGLTYACRCSRRELAGEGVYPGTCRSGPRGRGPAATRLRVDLSATIDFDDGLQGPQSFPLAQLGDFVIRRRDGIFAYQLAVVVDDAEQGITDVVRGADLLTSTPWQIALQRSLEAQVPRHTHLPLVLDRDGDKLSKSRRSLALDPAQAAGQLAAALSLLRLPPPAGLAGAPPPRLLEWAVPRWPPAGLRGLRELLNLTGVPVRAART
jgi:glutamyl-Q tRNA(Asp) synthetase